MRQQRLAADFRLLTGHSGAQTFKSRLSSPAMAATSSFQPSLIWEQGRPLRVSLADPFPGPQRRGFAPTQIAQRRLGWGDALEDCPPGFGNGEPRIRPPVTASSGLDCARPPRLELRSTPNSAGHFTRTIIWAPLRLARDIPEQPTGPVSPRGRLPPPGSTCYLGVCLAAMAG